MKEPMAVCVQGPKDSGKTSALLAVFDELKSRYPEMEILDELLLVDVRIVFRIGCTTIGLESNGDPPPRRLETSLKFFVEANCDIVLVPCRTYGATVAAVESLRRSGYRIRWLSKKRSSNPAAQAASDRAIVDTIIAEIEAGLAAAA